MEDISKFKARLEKVYDTGNKPKNNLETMLDYIREIKHHGLSDHSIGLYYFTFRVFSDWLDKPMDDLTSRDILKFLDHLDEHTYTINGKEKHYSQSSIKTFKVLLKKFFGDIDRPDLVKVLRDRGSPKRKKIDRNDLLDESDIETLIAASQTPRDKAMISVFFESGCRRGEFLSSQVKDLEFTEAGCKLRFPEGKTGERTVQLVYSTILLHMWVETHPCRLQDSTVDPNAPLWVSLYGKPAGAGRRAYSRLSEQGLQEQLKKIARRAGITKKVNPHSFRHAAASRLSEHLTESQLKEYLGWTQSSNMPGIYVHNPDTENAILKMNGIEIEEPENRKLKINRCPRCREVNPNSLKFCGKCGMPLNHESASLIAQGTTDLNLELMKAALQDPGILQVILEGIEKSKK